MRSQRLDPSTTTAVEQVLDAYGPLEMLGFAYGQGSVFAGLVDDSDLDINLIWDHAEVPEVAEIRGATDRSRFHQPGFALEKMHINGRQVDVVHHTKQAFDGWWAQVAAGDGWQAEVWPQPLYAISGFAYGVVLEDPEGLAAGAAKQLETFPELLIERSHSALAKDLPSFDHELSGCVRRGDGWLFHYLLTRLLRTAYVAWFSKHKRYCPHPKRLSAWADRFGLDDGIADLDVQLWTTPGLAHRRDLAHAIAEQVLDRR